VNRPSAAEEVLRAVGRIRSGGRESTTNVFASIDQLRRWMDRGTLEWECGGDALLIYRRDRDFYHLYHAAVSPSALTRALRMLQTDHATKVLTSDLVGRESDVSAVADVYASCGFRCHSELMRMARVGGERLPEEETDPEVHCAEASDAPAIVAFMERLLDRFAEQIPDEDEIRSEAAKRNVLIVRRGADLGGVLIVAPQGRTATLRYWWVNERFRDQGIGARLIRTMFGLCREMDRIILWVIADNTNAIRRYEHYGFRRDGLVDVIMLKDAR
jgi:ribosomal protein S18 acetylase RimI-like enzyme